MERDEKAGVETRQYVISRAGSDGKLWTRGRNSQYYNGSVGRHDLRDPAMLSISVRPERYSYDIIRETGEFVVNLTSKELTRATDWCGVKSGRDVDKFKEMNLTAAPAVHLKGAPIIAESPVNIECKVKDVLELGSHHMFIAEVAGVQVSEKYMNETGKFELNKLGLVAYSHGEYFELGEKIGKFGYSVKKS